MNTKSFEIHVWRQAFSWKQSKGMDCKHTHTLTHPCLSRSKVIPCPLKVGEGRVAPGRENNLKASEEGKDSVYRHTKPAEGRPACDRRHMWWQTYKSTRMNPKAACQEMWVGLWTFSMCIWSELSLWLYVHQKQKSKINHAKFSPCTGSIPLAVGLAGNNPRTL